MTYEAAIKNLEKKIQLMDMFIAEALALIVGVIPPAYADDLKELYLAYQKRVKEDCNE